MSGTQVNQSRITVVASGVNTYTISATCIIPGTLPDMGIFLLSINTPTDPKDDTLVRVNQVGDFSEYLTSRPAALTAGDVYWRSAALTLTYTNIDEADEAWKELSSRINKLVEEVDAYNVSFETPAGGITTTYPAVDSSTLNKYIADYVTARDAVTTAEEARDAKQVSCNTLQTALTVAQQELQIAQTDIASLAASQVSLAAIQASLTVVSTGLGIDATAVRALNAVSSALPGEKVDIEGGLTNMDARLLTFSAQNASFLAGVATIISSVSILQTRVSTLTTSRNTTQTAFSLSTSEVGALQATVDATRATRDAALAAILTIDPTFDPSTA